MKGIPIKFRAKDIDGNVYFGYLNFFGITWSISGVTADGIKTIISGYNSMEIELYSVAQLVGYDADGNEVYEDDKLILGSHEYIASVRPVSYTDDKKYYMPEKDFSDFLLKEKKKMTEKILPLPVKKNKFGQHVADISVNEYYRQIMEEVLEAHAEDLLWTASLSDIEDAQAEELVDVITCCVTRFAIRHQYDDEPFDVERVVTDALKRYHDAYKENFYIELASKTLYAFNAAKTAEFVEELLFGSESGCNRCVIEFELDADEETLLADIIALCVKRLEYLGYDEDARQKLYQAVNDKNQSRGYFED